MSKAKSNEDPTASNSMKQPTVHLQSPKVLQSYQMCCMSIFDLYNAPITRGRKQHKLMIKCTYQAMSDLFTKFLHSQHNIMPLLINFQTTMIINTYTKFCKKNFGLTVI